MCGIMHAKGVYVDEYLVMGSSNWTTSSRSNRELGCLLYVPRLAPEKFSETEELLEVFWDEGVEFEDQELQRALVPK